MGGKTVGSLVKIRERFRASIQTKTVWNKLSVGDERHIALSTGVLVSKTDLINLQDPFCSTVQSLFLLRGRVAQLSV